jgi:uncharacterized oligopeptide transporter (OPT) family protein
MNKYFIGFLVLLDAFLGYIAGMFWSTNKPVSIGILIILIYTLILIKHYKKQ